MIFSIKKAFKDSWNMFFSKKIYLPFVFASLVSVAGIYLLLGLGGAAGSFFLMRGLWWLLIPTAIILIFFLAYFILAGVYLPLDTHMTKKVDFKKVFTSVWDYTLILKSIGLILMVLGSIVVVGYLLSLLVFKLSPILVPIFIGVLVALVTVRFAFAMYILIETRGGVFSSLKKSHTMMKGNGWKFLLFIVSIVLISIVVQTVTNVLASVSQPISQIITIAFGVAVAPWFSLVTISPYIQLKK